MNPSRAAIVSLLCVTLAACVSIPDYQKSRFEAFRNQNAGNYVEAEKYHRLTLQQMQASGMTNLDLAMQMSNLASAMLSQYKVDEEVINLVEESLRLLNLEQNPGVVALVAVLSNHGDAMAWQGRLEEAEADCQRMQALPELEESELLSAAKHHCIATTSVLKNDFAGADAANAQFETALAEMLPQQELERILPLSRNHFRRLKEQHLKSTQ